MDSSGKSLRHFEELGIGIITGYILELVGGRAKAWIGVGTLDQNHQVIRIPAFVDHAAIAVIANRASRDHHGDAGALASEAVDELLAKLFGIDMRNRSAGEGNVAPFDTLHRACDPRRVDIVAVTESKLRAHISGL
jgi:hypothetical protein